SAAIAVHPSRIIIKRPLKGPFLAGRKPDYSLPGKAIRYDVILL
ncbi:MAG: class I SAM-dependent methyltransferase, partial [Erysipelotrichaceae bacterium]|nr:class I SAM-dependent methyltransferase [Erysipelotrichaceae bacterium]